MGLINTLGSFIYKTSYDDLPPSVIITAKERMLDFLGGALSECKDIMYEPIFNFLKMYGGKKESTVIGKKTKLPCNSAAMMNSAMSAEMGDGCRSAGLHPGSTVIPAALATSEAMMKTRITSGKDLILAIVLGYDIMIRVGQAINPSALKRGFHPTGIVGPLGSATAVSKLLNLDQSTTTNALSMATIFGSGLIEAFKAPHPFVQIQMAKTCEAGITCALMAQSGIKGNDTILEEGFIPAFSDEYRLDLIEKDLGKDFMILKTHIKMHGGCAHIHASIDAAVDIIEKYGINLEDILQIKVETYTMVMDLHIENPKSGDQAMFNIPFCISARLLYGDAFADKFTDKNLKSEQIQKLMRKITVIHNPALDVEFPRKRGTIVTITTNDGRIFSQGLDLARGEPELPFSKSEIENKFQYLASKAIDLETRQKIIEFIDKLETASEISSLFTYLETS